MARVMIVANDVVATNMAGPGIRCAELARQLSAAGGHLVTLVTVGPTDLSLPSVEILTRPSVEEMMVGASAQDVIILEGIALARYPDLRRLPVPLVFDLYDPFPLALLEQEAQRPSEERNRHARRVRRVLREMLRSGDFFVCASEMQRDLWAGALLAEGRINPETWEHDNSLRQLLDVVPFGLPADEPPLRETVRHLAGVEFRDDDVILLWGGGIYNWFDPLTLIRAVEQTADPLVKLVFMSTGHPNPSVPERMWMPARARELSDQLGLTGSSVHFNPGWVPYSERGRWLAAADAGVSTHFEHAETHYAYRTRMLDYLWAGLPIICTSGDYFARLVAERQLGWVVDPEDVAGLAGAIRHLAAGPETRVAIRARVLQVAREMTWERVSVPLQRFCAEPRPAADLPRRKWVRRRRPTRWELRARQGGQLAALAARELATAGPGATLRKATRWWASRGSR